MSTWQDDAQTLFHSDLEKRLQVTPDDHKTVLAAGTEKHQVATQDDIATGHSHDPDSPSYYGTAEDGDYQNENGQGINNNPYFVTADRWVNNVPADVQERWDDADPEDFPEHWLEQASNNGLYPGYLPKLDPLVKAGWVEDLRSGTFYQCKNDLKRRDDDGLLTHCCLGVLYERFGDVTQEPRPNGSFVFKEPRDDTPGGFTIHESMPGAKVRQWSGLPYKVASVLAEANDNGATFRQIADFIDAEM